MRTQTPWRVLCLRQLLCRFSVCQVLIFVQRIQILVDQLVCFALQVFANEPQVFQDLLAVIVAKGLHCAVPWSGIQGEFDEFKPELGRFAILNATASVSSYATAKAQAAYRMRFRNSSRTWQFQMRSKKGCTRARL